MPQVLVLMGSQSDASTMKHCVETLDKLGVTYNAFITSAHRTPDRTLETASCAEGDGYKAIIAAAGLAAALPGDVAAYATVLPVFGVPMENALDVHNLSAILTMVDLPPGTPVGVLPLGKHGAINAALLAAQVVGNGNSAVREAVRTYREAQTAGVDMKPNFNPPPKS